MEDAGRGTTGVAVAVGLLAAAGAVVIGVGVAIQYATVEPGNPRGWYVAGGFMFLAAALVYVWHFLWMPHVGRLVRARAAEAGGHTQEPGSYDPATTGGRLQIMLALYGAGGAWNDVTQSVALASSQDALSMTVANATLGGDPTPNVPKLLRLWYVYDGKGHLAEAAEGERLTI